MSLPLDTKQKPISGIVRIGDRFTFVHADGRCGEYVVEHVEGEAIEQTPPMYARMRNLAPGGGLGWATLKWLTDGELLGRAHWLRSEAKAEAA